MNTEITHIEVAGCRRYHWMAGKSATDVARRDMLRAMKLLAAIEIFETKYIILINQSMSNPFDLAFPEMKRKTIHNADIAKRAALRLRQSFNNLINEISL